MKRNISRWQAGSEICRVRRSLLTAAQAGCIIIPPKMAFLQQYQTVEQQIARIIGKILMQFGLEYRGF